MMDWKTLLVILIVLLLVVWTWYQRGDDLG
jgi:hypothetical protein